ncbi:MAG TPA: flagellar basal body L-ring protein FlgH [Gammaproteobacteria bacterium]|nr:flagellar basal body L-ring protein FlgH [Gammaproteobacteria bacterium]
MAVPRALLLMPLLALLGGCAMAPPSQPPQALPEPDLHMPKKQVTGGIYQSGQDVRLYEDRTARRVGDVITVQLQEETDASKDANTDVGRQYDYKMDAPTLAGTTPKFRGNPISFDVGSDQNFKGGGSSTQSNALSGTLTAIVTRVQPNGNLVIQGQKKITLNQGDEYVTITGIVRPDDINPNNTVSSRRVANARLSYTGSGALADSNQMGWLSRLFMSVVWPF